MYGMELREIPARQLHSVYTAVETPSLALQRSMCRALRIQTGFFEKQKVAMQHQIIDSKKLLAETSTFYGLFDNDEFRYVTKQAPFIDKSPRDSFLGEEWALDRSHWEGGYMKYSKSLGEQSLEKWTGALFLTVPIMYERMFYATAGLRRLICSNGMSLTRHAAGLQISPKQHLYTILDSLCQGSHTVNTLTEVADLLNDYPMSVDDALIFVQSLRDDNVLSMGRPFLRDLSKQLIHLPEDDPTLPSEIATYGDFINVFTRVVNRDSVTFHRQTDYEHRALQLAHMLVQKSFPTIVDKEYTGFQVRY